MAIPKILLYYVFTPLADPDAVRVWQRDLCESLGLRGRILISTDGMNGTIGGDLKAVKRYLHTSRSYAPLANLDVKWSEGSTCVCTTASIPPRRVKRLLTRTA